MHGPAGRVGTAKQRNDRVRARGRLGQLVVDPSEAQWHAYRLVVGAGDVQPHTTGDRLPMQVEHGSHPVGAQHPHLAKVQHHVGGPAQLLGDPLGHQPRAPPGHRAGDPHDHHLRQRGVQPHLQIRYLLGHRPARHRRPRCTGRVPAVADRCRSFADHLW